MYFETVVFNLEILKHLCPKRWFENHYISESFAGAARLSLACAVTTQSCPILDKQICSVI